METALACHPHNIELLAPIVDHWIVDIKDMNPRIREKYTGRVGDSAHQLCYLKQYGIVDKVTIRVPHIPGFNTVRMLIVVLSKLRSWDLRLSRSLSI